MTSKNDYEVVIKPSKTWLSINLVDLIHYRDLLVLLVRRDFVAHYKQTVLGPTWFILQPLMMTLVFTVIFGKVAKIPTDNIPPLLFYLCGLVIWKYFADCLNKNASTFVTNARLFGKVYFPRLVVPIAVVISNLLAFIIQLTTFLAFFIYYKYFTTAGTLINPNITIALLPLFVLQTAMLGLGVSLWMSALTAKYRDLSHLMQFLVQLWMYATPIIYPLSMISGKWKPVIAVNPMCSVVETFRFAFLGAGNFDMKYISISGAITLFLLFSGIMLFNRVEKTFIDTV